MNTGNSKTNEPHRFRLTLADKHMALANLSIYYAWKKIKSAYKNNKFKISAPAWNNEFDLLDGTYSFLEIQDYFEYIMKKHETIANNPSVQIYVNKIKNRTAFEIKTGYKLELLSLEAMKLLIIKKHKKSC